MTWYLFDIGNARVKYAQLTERSFVYGKPCTHTSLVAKIEAGKLAFGKHSVMPPTRILLSSVWNPLRTNYIKEALEKTYGLSVWQAQTQTVYQGMRNGYQHPERLGVDRWLAMLPCWQRVRGAFCVIDCGTAVTVDVVDHEGQHRGGQILPGLHLMRRALRQGAHALRDIDSAISMLDQPWGTNTSAGVAAGTLQALIAYIHAVYQQANRRFGPELPCFITGGDAAHVCRYLTLPFIEEPHLVLQGLPLAYA